MLSLLDRAVELKELKSIVSSSEVKNLTTELNALTYSNWRFCIQQLRESKLVSIRNSGQDLVLDCHPIVRDFGAEYLKFKMPVAWSQGNELLFDFYTSGKLEYPESMHELEPLFRAVTHGVYAGRVQEAFNIYFLKIKRKQFSMFAEGSHHADQACIRAFFQRKWDKPLDSLTEEAKGYLLSSAATNLIYLGDINSAIDPALKSIEWYINNGKWLEAASASAPLMSMLIMAGEMPKALALKESMSTTISRSGNKVIQGMASNFNAYLNFLVGENEQASENFAVSEKILLSCKPESPAPFPTISSYYCKFLLETGRTKKALNRALKTFGWRHQTTWQVAIDTTSLLASDMLILGLIFLEIGDKINAKKYLDRQVELFKSTDEWLYLPTGLSSRARFHMAVNDFEAALKDLEEAIEISKRTGAKFGEWEAYIDMAQLQLQTENFESSDEFLTKAKSLENMEMYRFRDKQINKLEETLANHLPHTTNNERMPRESIR